MSFNTFIAMGFAVLLILVRPCFAAQFETSGYIAFDWREHYQSAQFDRRSASQASHQLSIVAEPEFIWSLNHGKQTVVFKPFARLDSEDDERSHGDIRELSWLAYGDDWEVEVGIAKQYWGVTESQHLVDIINQTDLIESPDGEDKLGQPMVKYTLVRDWGTLESFILPWFRERTFPGADGRLRTGLVIDTGRARYQNDHQYRHIDYALRWSHSVDVVDIGLSWFQGTSREPLLTPRLSRAATGQYSIASLIPFYPLVEQAGLDIQATLGASLLKLEVIRRNFDHSVRRDFAAKDQNVTNFTAATVGFEYTFYGPFETSWELGVLGEYLYDSRRDQSVTAGQNDLFVGTRIAFNDEASTDILAGITQDLDDSGSRVIVVEMTTRLSPNITVSFDAWFFTAKDSADIIYQVRRDDFVQASFSYYF